MRIIKIYLDTIKDADLISDWESYPHTEKSEAVKQKWRTQLQSTPVEQEKLDLNAIRQVMEAVFDSKLAGLTFGRADGKQEETDPLDTLDDSLLLD